MNWSGFARCAIAAVTLCCFGLPQAEAIEILAGPSPVVHMNDGMISKVVVVRRGGGAYRGGYHGGVYRGPHGGVYRGGTVYRGGAYRGGAYRGGAVYRGGAYRYGGWARPGWYHWGPGGAIAAGAALGFVGAAAASWAGPAPGPGLCWYYTDPSRQQGFWDACP